jgi:hypothetical protein
VVLVWNGRPVSGSLTMALDDGSGDGVARTAQNGCYRITADDRCGSGRPSCSTSRLDVGRNPLANDNDVNVAYWGRPTDDVWFPTTVAVPPLPPRGVNGAVVPLTPASKAEGSVAGLPKGHRATVYAVDDEGGVARVATTGHAFTLGGLRSGRYTIFCTTRDGFPYDFGRPDTPTGSVRVTVTAAAAPDAPLVRIPTCRPTGAGSPTLVRALKAWDPNAELGGQPLP